MKQLILSTLILLASHAVFAVTHHIVIDDKNLMYLPNVLTAQIGDSIIIEASAMHPLVQVDQNTWNNNEANPMGGGWGVQTSDYGFMIEQAGDIYYVCQNHVESGMKGKIEVSVTGLAESAAPEIKLYPSYVTGGYFNVSIANAPKEQNMLNVYNMAGQLTGKYVLAKAQNVVDIDLPPGVYIYTVSNMANTKVLKTGKFVITKS